MKKSELLEYLKKFNRDREVVVLVVNGEARNRYPVLEIMCATDMGDPVIVIDVGSPVNLDTENLEHTDLTDQLQMDL